MTININKKYFGYVPILGEKNVGKSTIFNNLIKFNLSNVSRRTIINTPIISGIYTNNIYQIEFFDIPYNIISNSNNILNINSKINYLNFNKSSVIILIIDKLDWLLDKNHIFLLLKNILNIPILLIFNKVNIFNNKNILLPYIKYLNKLKKFNNIFLLSNNINKDIILIRNYISLFLVKKKEFIYIDKITNLDNSILIVEIIKNKIFKYIYSFNTDNLCVLLKDFFILNSINHIYVIIHVNSIYEKKCLIGKNGKVIKFIGIKSRIDLEIILKNRINLKLWIKCKNTY